MLVVVVHAPWLLTRSSYCNFAIPQLLENQEKIIHAEAEKEIAFQGRNRECDEKREKLVNVC